MKKITTHIPFAPSEAANIQAGVGRGPPQLHNVPPQSVSLLQGHCRLFASPPPRIPMWLLQPRPPMRSRVRF